MYEGKYVCMYEGMCMCVCVCMREEREVSPAQLKKNA